MEETTMTISSRKNDAENQIDFIISRSRLRRRAVLVIVGNLIFIISITLLVEYEFTNLNIFAGFFIAAILIINWVPELLNINKMYKLGDQPYLSIRKDGINYYEMEPSFIPWAEVTGVQKKGSSFIILEVLSLSKFRLKSLGARFIILPNITRLIEGKYLPIHVNPSLDTNRSEVLRAIEGFMPSRKP